MKSQAILPYSPPEAQGISSRSVLAFVEAADRHIQELHSFMLLRHGQVTAEGWWAPYAPQRPHMLFSLSKSFTSTAIGLAVQEGLLSIADPVLSYFPEQAPARVSPHLAALRIRDLLSMSSGHAVDTTGRMTARKDGDWVKGFLALPVKHKPGTHFVYNSGASYMLSAILQKVSGMTLLDFLKPRLFEPLGIERPTWESCPRGINTGGWGLSIRTEDIARFGQMYLQKGRWNGRQILPEEWIAQATAFQISNSHPTNADWRQGYGFQFWRSQHEAYRGDGAFGQFCVVMPAQDAVLAITSGVGNMQAVLDLVWSHLLPAMQPKALPADPQGLAALEARLAGLALRPPAGALAAPVSRQLAGKTYRFKANPLKIRSMRFDFSANGCELEITDSLGSYPLSCGLGAWQENRTSLFSAPTRPLSAASRRPGELSQAIAASCVWTADDTLQITLRRLETPFYHSLSCRFMGDQVQVTHERNIGLDALKPTLLEGIYF